MGSDLRNPEEDGVTCVFCWADLSFLRSSISFQALAEGFLEAGDFICRMITKLFCIWDLLEIPTPGAGFCHGCFSYQGTVAENIRDESLLWAGAPFSLTLVYVQNHQNLWKVAAKLCSYKTQPSKETACRFHASVCCWCLCLSTWLSLMWGYEYAEEGKQSLRSLVSYKAIFHFPFCPQTQGDCGAPKHHAETLRAVQRLCQRRRAGTALPRPSGSSSAAAVLSAGGWLQHGGVGGGVEREARRDKSPLKIEGDGMRC